MCIYRNWIFDIRNYIFQLDFLLSHIIHVIEITIFMIFFGSYLNNWIQGVKVEMIAM